MIAPMSTQTLTHRLSVMRPELIRIYRNRLRSIEHRFDSEDLVQTVSLRAIEGWANCKGQSAEEIDRWLSKIAANCFQTALREHQASQRRSVLRELASLPAGGEPQHQSASTESAEPVDQRDCLDRVRESVLRLPQSQQTCFSMRFFQSKNDADIALKMGISRGAVRQNVSYALRKLRAELNLAPSENQSGAVHVHRKRLSMQLSK